MSLTAAAGLVTLVTGLVLLAVGTTRLVRTASGWRRWLALPVAFVVFQFVLVPLFAALVITNPPPNPVIGETPRER